jgi:hypothetical protein
MSYLEPDECSPHLFTTFSIILRATPTCSLRALSNILYAFLISSIQATHGTQLMFRDLIKLILLRVQIIKFLIINFHTISHYFHSLMSNHSLQHPVVKQPWDKIEFHTHTTPRVKKNKKYIIELSM